MSFFLVNAVWTMNSASMNDFLICERGDQQVRLCSVVPSCRTASSMLYHWGCTGRQSWSDQVAHRTPDCIAIWRRPSAILWRWSMRSRLSHRRQQGWPPADQEREWWQSTSDDMNTTLNSGTA
jgi:hypothetical protein